MIPPLAIDMLAAYRATRLVTADTITAPIRDEIVAFAYVARDGEDSAYETLATHGGSWTEIAMDDLEAPKLATLVTCRWCTSWWISLLIVWARRRHPRQWEPISQALALSAAAVLAARLET